MSKLTLASLILVWLPYFAVAQPVGVPTNLRALLNQESNLIHLTWDLPDINVAGYNLFVKTSSQANFYLLGKAGLIFGTAYDYQIVNKTGDFYEFKICAVNNFPEVIRSDFSNTVLVEVPSTYLPMVNIGTPKIKKNIATLSWSYSTPATDFQGFILFLDEEEILIEKESRKYVFDELSSGKHIVQLAAYTTSGLQSNLSNKKFILIK
jgi:hypothetical protein